MNKKGWIFPALATAILVVFIILLVATFYAPFRYTLLAILTAIFG